MIERHFATLLPLVLGLSRVFFLFYFLGAFSGFALAASPGDEAYASLLATHVKSGRVDYEGLKKDEEKLDRYLDALARTDSSAFASDELFAFYANAYNAWTIKLVLKHYPGLKSIKDIGSFLSSPWKIPLVRLKIGLFTLDQIEHELLRPRFKDPRVHVAVNCASKSCPPLRSEPYDGQRLQAQLDDAARSFVNSPNGALVKDGAVYLSKIFDWYAQDFGGRAGVLAFVRKYADDELLRGVESLGADPHVRFLNYDWTLNGE
jgi:hypothetical protein